MGLRTIIREEMQKLMSQPQDNPSAFSNAVLLNYSGNTFYSYVKIGSNNWLIDSGASCHIEVAKNLFSSLEPLIVKPNIFLLNGSIFTPSHTVTIHISPSIVLHQVYFVPKSKFNFPSVSCLLKSTLLTLMLYSDHCLIQDQNSR